MSSIRATIPLAMLLLSGCVVGPDHKAPETQMPVKFAEGGNATNGDVATVAWWNAFNDSRLNGYVETGLSQNLTVLQALERINQAESQITVAGAGALPSLTGSASHSTSQTSGSLPTATSRVQNRSAGGLDVSWLLDLFGQYRRSKESASARLDAAYSTADVQRLTLISSVVAAYIDVRYFQERLAIARENLKSRRETLDLTKLQLEAGAASRLDVVQSEGLVNSTLADMPGLETNFRQAAHRIATLLGMPASSLVMELQRGARQPVARRPATTGIPADLIRNRPDIRVAERRLAAATAEIGVAESRLYPSITISGSIAPSLVNISNNGSRGTSNTWSFGPSLVLPILDGGSLRANVDIAKSSAREQYLAWKATVLNAIEEVENALAAVNRDKQTEDALRRTVKSYQEALSLATASYRDGASSLLDVLDAQRQVSTAQANLATAVQKTAQDYVSLSIALGGGYAIGGPQTVAGTKVAANTPKGM